MTNCYKFLYLTIILLCLEQLGAVAPGYNLHINDTKAHVAQDTIPVEDRYGDFINDESNNPFDLQDPKAIEQEVEYDPKTNLYKITEKIGEDYYRMPTYMTFQEYLDYRAKKQQEDIFKQLAGVDSKTRTESGKTDPLVKYDVSKSLADRLFGGTEVDIRPEGNINITFGGDFQNIENPILSPRQQRQGEFDFDMDIQMSVTGQIGEKLKLSTNYNTQATFDFDNQLKIEYDTDAFSEDEIIKDIQAGNVSLPLTSKLISGSTSLFGVRTDLQFGALRLSLVASQQRSERENIKIE